MIANTTIDLTYLLPYFCVIVPFIPAYFMHKTILFLFLIGCCFSQITTHAQPYTISGTVIDTLNDNRLQHAAVTVIRSKDSVLETFTRTQQEGQFQINLSHAGKYIVMITFPGLVDYVETILLSPSQPSVSMGQVPMVSKSYLLSEYVLKQEIAAIKIKGDTTEYVADSFKVRDNATVEELLKKLPGLQVNKNGEITAQGEKVQKIMVDGEEFFTDDPAVVSKSLQAKAVDKVQVFDKKSEQAEFTGIDDGVREKTINLKLKDNSKRGYFGKAVAGGGTDGRYENQLMLNAFKNKRKIAAFGIGANTGKVGLGWDERDKYSGGNNTQTNEDGYTYRYYESDGSDGNWNGNFSGQGIPSAWTGGLHYSNKWLQDQLHFNSNYRYSNLQTSTQGATLTQYNLDTLQYYKDERRNAHSTNNRHSLDVRAEYKLDSLTTLRLTARGGNTHMVNNESYEAESKDTMGTVFNNNTRRNNVESLSQYQNATLSLQRKFLKKGRTFAATLNERYNQSKADNYLLSTVTTQLSPTPQYIDQQKENHHKNLQADISLSYTEPLSKVVFWETNYSYAINNNSAKRLSYNKNTDGNYTVLDSLYSSHYEVDIQTHKGGSNLRLVYKKMNISFGGAIAGTQFHQKDQFTNRDFRRSFINFFPNASITYRPRQQQSFSLRYYGNTQQPTIDQLQPIRQNTDPLNISIGNPNLKQEFNHSLNFYFNDYKVFSALYKYLSMSFYFVNNDISQSQTISDNFIRTYQYTNVNGNYNGSMYGGMGKNFRKLNIGVNLNGGFNLSNSYSYMNGEKNRNDNKDVSLSIGGNYSKDSLCEIELDFSTQYNMNYASINKSQTNYFSYATNFNVNFFLPKRFEIGTSFDWDIRQKVAAFDNNNNVFLWNAHISKKFLKGDALELRASAYDILNQNKGYSRVAYANTITQQNYNTLRRYAMLSLIWNFTKSSIVTTDNSTQITTQED